MEIEVITTKKKISKAMVKQFSPATIGDMNHFTSMRENGYYIRDLGGKFANRVALFKGINEWVVMDIRDWYPCGELRAESKSEKGFGVLLKTFQSDEARTMWLEAYNNTKNLCLKNHLII